MTYANDAEVKSQPQTATRTRKTRKPLRDIKPLHRHAHQDSTVVIGDWGESPFQVRYKLLKKTIRTVILRGGLESLWMADPKDGQQKPSALLNDLIETATADGLYLLRRPQVTSLELPLAELFWGGNYGQVKDFVQSLTLPAFSDAELIRQAKCVADKLVKSQKIIKRPYKRDEAGNLLRRNGKLVKGYKCVGLRTEHPTQNLDIHDQPVQAWTSPIDTVVCAPDGRPINGGRTTNYACAATDALVNNFQRQALREVLAGYLGPDDAEWLLDYQDGRFPDSTESDEMAELLTEKLAPYRAELEKFRSLLT